MNQYHFQFNLKPDLNNKIFKSIYKTELSVKNYIYCKKIIKII